MILIQVALGRLFEDFSTILNICNALSTKLRAVTSSACSLPLKLDAEDVEVGCCAVADADLVAEV